jgi:hypothetical protein
VKNSKNAGGELVKNSKNAWLPTERQVNTGKKYMFFL